MAESKRNHRIQRFLSDDRATDASSAATDRRELSRSVNNLKMPIRNLFHRLNRGPAAKHLLPSRVPYQYTPLNDDLREIRLLTLHEGRFNTDIHISIHTAPLDPYNPPTYEALSYVWGSQEKPIDIQVGVQNLAVTQKLAQALSYLRYSDKPRTLWIDAICVNQQDLKERSRQVRRMADLYRLADRVVVWLGPGDKASGYGVRIFKDLSSKITVDWIQVTMKPTSNGAEKHWADQNEYLPYGDKEFRAIYSVMNRPWFERLWIWQEIRLAKSNAVMICGSDEIPWESFRTALYCLYWKVYRIKQSSVISEQFSARVIKTYPLADSEINFNFLDAMYNTRHCKYTDPRDRVYAILSLLEGTVDAIGIEPDYTKRTSQIYQYVVLRCIDQHNSLNILSSSGLSERPLEMPTWVPDWTIGNTPFPFQNGLASGQTVAEVRYRGAGILRVTGSISATVQHVDRMEFRDFSGLIAEIQRLAPQDVLRGSYVGSGSLLTAYCTTLCAGAFGDTYLPSDEYLPQSQQSLDFLSAILQPGIKQDPVYSPDSQAVKFLRFVGAYCKARSFIKTREGHIGLAPQHAQSGDQICILLGCDLPMLLRPTSESQYQVVGPCYVHGLMNGEAFLGPIPEHFQWIDVFEEPKRQFFRGLLDRRTGKTQYNDPRIESLPEDDSDEAVPMIRSPDGSQQRYLTPEMIERRGVKLQTFDLV